jgi:hypothetical protein
MKGNNMILTERDTARRLPEGFWGSATIKPIPKLEELRDQVLTRSTKRMPKWKFRLDNDLIVQIQPKVSDYFECFVVSCPRPSPEDFGGRPYGEGWARVKFELIIREQDWKLKPKNIDRSKDVMGQGVVEVVTRLIHKLNGSIFETISAEMMLAPNCLLCGKALKDPVSMARFIGPECAGTSSNKVPRTTHLDQMQTTTAYKCERQDDGSVKETPANDFDVHVYDRGDGQVLARTHPKQEPKAMESRSYPPHKNPDAEALLQKHGPAMNGLLMNDVGAQTQAEKMAWAEASLEAKKRKNYSSQCVFDTVLDALVEGETYVGAEETVSALAQAIACRFSGSDIEDLFDLVRDAAEDLGDDDIETSDEHFLRTMDPTKVGKMTFLPEVQK